MGLHQAYPMTGMPNVGPLPMASITPCLTACTASFPRVCNPDWRAAPPARLSASSCWICVSLDQYFLCIITSEPFVYAHVSTFCVFPHQYFLCIKASVLSVYHGISTIVCLHINTFCVSWYQYFLSPAQPYSRHLSILIDVKLLCLFLCFRLLDLRVMV